MRIFLTIFFFGCFIFKTEAQTNNSPYSIAGIGDLNDSYLNRTTGLGSTGIAYRSNRSMISNNPASFSALENQFFMGEIGVRGKYIGYSGQPVSQTNSNSSEISFNQFSLGIKVKDHWGTSVGLSPVSAENYEFNSEGTIGGTAGETITTFNQGYGGINKVYWTNAYELFHHLSLGVTGSYYFGSINQKQILQNQNVASTYVSTDKNIFYSNFVFDYGAQVFGKIGKRWDYVLGGTFSSNTRLRSSSTKVIRDIDSVQLNPYATESNGSLNIPYSYGLGLSLTKDKKYTFLADYRFQKWSDINTRSFDPDQTVPVPNNLNLQNSQRGSIGFEISKKKRAYNTYFETNYYQFGAYFSRGYLNISGEPIDDMGVTVGMGFNAKRSGLSTTVVLQYGIRGTESRNLVQEKYWALSFIISYRDFWYTKGRKFN